MTAAPRPDAPDSRLTLAAAGVLGATLAVLAHTGLGHAAACMAQGGEVARVGVVDFACGETSWVTHAAGPAAQFVAGFLAVSFLRLRPRWTPAVRFPLLILAAIALLWVSAQLVHDGLWVTGDFASSAGTWWRWLLVVGGLALYWISLSWLGPALDDMGHEAGPRAWSRLMLPLVTGAVAIVALAALNRADRWDSIRDALLAVVLAPLGYVLLAVRARRRLHAAAPAYPIARSWPLIAAAAAVFAGAAAWFVS